MMSIRFLESQVREAVLAPRQGLLKGKDRLYAARAFFEALQLQKDKKVCCSVQVLLPVMMRCMYRICTKSIATRGCCHSPDTPSCRHGTCAEQACAGMSVEIQRSAVRFRAVTLIPGGTAGGAAAGAGAGAHHRGAGGQLGAAAQHVAAAVAEHRRSRLRVAAGLRPSVWESQPVREWASRSTGVAPAPNSCMMW